MKTEDVNISKQIKRTKEGKYTPLEKKVTNKQTSMCRRVKTYGDERVVQIRRIRNPV